MTYGKEREQLLVTQIKEWGEILSGFECKNKYSISDGEGSQQYLAAEVNGSLMARWFLKASRPFVIKVFGDEGEELLTVDRRFTFYFHKVTITTADGKTLGSVQRRFSMMRRIYTVCDENDQEIYQLFGPILKPWTFIIKQGDQEHGKITKKWSGLMKEGFTDADNFGVEYPETWPMEHKLLMLGAVFLIDFVHFENTNND